MQRSLFGGYLKFNQCRPLFRICLHLLHADIIILLALLLIQKYERVIRVRPDQIQVQPVFPAEHTDKHLILPRSGLISSTNPSKFSKGPRITLT